MITENQGIYDARKLGKAKFAVLGVQHLFAMFGATISFRSSPAST